MRHAINDNHQNIGLLVQNKGGKSHQPLHYAFLTRLTTALEGLIAEIGDNRIAELLASSSDIEVLLSTLNLPEAAGLMLGQDQIAAAKLRGIAMRKQLLEAEGGCYKVTQVAEHLNISRQAVDKRRRNNKLLAVKAGSNDYLYPIWQFSNDGILPGIEEVLTALDYGEHDAWAKLAFFLLADFGLDNKSPLECLRLDNKQSVIRMASHYGLHGSI